MSFGAKEEEFLKFKVCKSISFVINKMIMSSFNNEIIDNAIPCEAS